MDLGLKGKKALLLASSQGLGLGVATTLCAEGADVLICGRVEDKLRDAADGLNASGPGKASYVVADLGDGAANLDFVLAEKTTNVHIVELVLKRCADGTTGSFT